MNRRTFIKGLGIAAVGALAPVTLTRRASANTWQRQVIRSYAPPSRLIPFLTSDPATRKRLRRLCRTPAFKYDLSPTANLIEHPRGLHLSEPHVNVAILRQAQIERLYQAALHRAPTTQEAGTALLWLARTQARPRRRTAGLSLELARANAQGWGGIVDVTCCNPEQPESAFFGTPQFQATVDAIEAEGVDGNTAVAAATALTAALGSLGLGAEAITIGLGIAGRGIAAGTISFGFAGGSLAGGLAVASFVGIGMLGIGMLGLYITWKIVEPTLAPQLPPSPPPPTPNETPTLPPATVVDDPPTYTIDITQTGPPVVTEPEATTPPDEPDAPDAPDGPDGTDGSDGSDGSDGGGAGGGDE
jgi:hypothetical protein